MNSGLPQALLPSEDQRVVTAKAKGDGAKRQPSGPAQVHEPVSQRDLRRRTSTGTDLWGRHPDTVNRSGRASLFRVPRVPTFPRRCCSPIHDEKVTPRSAGPQARLEAALAGLARLATLW
jgi:hypothetical protein